ncbi:MAG: hypothetical protein ACI8TQ_000653 [Planctomycetota bacterium]|jgi:hypothetical protein
MGSPTRIQGSWLWGQRLRAEGILAAKASFMVNSAALSGVGGNRDGE